LVVAVQLEGCAEVPGDHLGELREQIGDVRSFEREKSGSPRCLLAM
jgi:hypothetical protein